MSSQQLTETFKYAQDIFDECYGKEYTPDKRSSIPYRPYRRDQYLKLDLNFVEENINKIDSFPLSVDLLNELTLNVDRKLPNILDYLRRYKEEIKRLDGLQCEFIIRRGDKQGTRCKFPKLGIYNLCKHHVRL